MLGQQPFVVLTTAPARPGVALPPGLRLVSLHDCAWLDGDSIYLDRALIAEVARTAFSTADSRTNSGTRRPTTSSGFEVLSSDWDRSDARSSASCMRQARPISRGFSGKLLLPDPTKRMVDTFKNLKPSWRLLIESDGRGNYRLNL